MTKACKIESAFKTKFKVSVIGCGSVGATAAYSMLIDGAPTDMVLIDRYRQKADGLKLDFVHSLPFTDYMRITASDDYAECEDSTLIIITAGARQMEGETRLDLVKKNKAIFKDIIPAVSRIAPDSILLIIANPVDVLTYEALKLSGFPENRVFGSGTMLDTARFQFHISERLCLSPKSVEAYILGEHGDSSFPVYSSSNVAGKSLFDFEGFTRKVAEQCYMDTKEAAYRIINDLGYTCYSIGMVITEIMRAIQDHAKLVVPLSVMLNDYYGHSDVCLSVPCVLDSDGVSDVIKVPLNEEEQNKLAKSVDVLKEFI